MILKKFLTNIRKKELIKPITTSFLSLFYGSLVGFVSILSIVRHRSKYFEIKQRPFPPNCLNDETLGKHEFIKLNDIKLHYVWNGDQNKQLMLFVHGFPEFWYSWRHQMKEFANDYYVVALDQRGYGESEKPKSVHSYTVDKISNDIKHLVEGLGKSKIILVGHDWGGAITWNVAAKYPEIVDKLIIINSPHPLVFRNVKSKSWKQFLMSWYMYFFNLPALPEMVLLSNDIKLFNTTFISADGRKLCTDQELEAYKYVYSKPYGLTGPLNYYRAMIRDYPSERPTSYQIKMPTLTIWGKKDFYLSSALADSNKYVDNLTIKYIENCSHWAQMDQPDLVNQYIRQFLK